MTDTTDSTGIYDDGEHYLDRFGDTWEAYGSGFLHIARADDDGHPNPSVHRHYAEADVVIRDFGPMTPLRSSTMTDTTPPAGVPDFTREVRALFTELERLRAVEAAAYAFADEMGDYCSPHGVAALYADRLRDRLQQAGGTA